MRIFSASFVVVLFALATSTVFAQGGGSAQLGNPSKNKPATGLAPVAPPPAEAENPEYKRAVEQALEEYKLGHFTEARSLFEKAHDIDPNARTLRGLGMVEFELRHYVRATELLDEALKNTRKPLTDEQRKSVEDLLSRARQFIANYELSVEPPRTDVVVELDGKAVTVGAQGKLSLEAGEHTLRISGPEGSSRELRLDVKGGEQQTLHIELEVKQPQQQAVLPPPPVQQEIYHPHRTLGITLTAVGAAVAIAGAVLGVLALTDANDAKTRNDSSADSAHSLALGSDIAIPAGVITAGVGVAFWMAEAKRDKGRTVQIEGGLSRVRVRF